VFCCKFDDPKKVAEYFEKRYAGYELTAKGTIAERKNQKMDKDTKKKRRVKDNEGESQEDRGKVDGEQTSAGEWEDDLTWEIPKMQIPGLGGHRYP
jgi:hypothetical protein